MSREIKFRAWHFGEMLYQAESGHHEVARLFNRIHGNTPVMQYTGLKDRNGKDIYDGDIIKTVNDKSMVIGWSERFASFVIMREGWAFQHWFGESCDPQDCEVIGNIHQDKHLLS